MGRLLAAVFAILSLFASIGLRADTTLVSAGSVWKYLDNGSDQGTAWRGNSFSDSSWASGPAELGYGDAAESRPEATVVSYGPDSANRYITTYFRQTFNVPDASGYGSLKLRVVRDDGVVVYLNGQEIWRDKMPTGTIGYRTLATAALGGADEYTFAEIIVPATHLRSGSNVIAAEIHQANVTSTDISFNLELIGRPPGLVRQPYLQIGTPTSMTIRWRTDIATDSVVRYGPAATSLSSEIVQDVATPKTDHVVTITGLTPDTRYYYSVGSSSVTYASGEAHVFYTAPPAGSAHPTRIWAIGDAGTGTANQAAVRNAYYSYAQGGYTDVMLMLGDNAYDNGTDSEYTTKHFDVYRDILRQTVTWPTIGNHDTASSSNPLSNIAYYQSFSLPTAAQAGGVPSGTKDYYSFDYGDIHFICLDSMTENRGTNGAMATWLEQDLANTTQKWLIAFWHHPPYSKGHNSDTETNLVEMRSNIVPVLEDYGVDLVLCGHSHAYERSYFLDGHYGTSSTLNPATMFKDGSNGRGVGGYNKPTLEGAGHEGAVYAVAGSSGKAENYAGISDSGTGNGTGHPANFISWERLGSLIIEIDGHRLDAKFLRENGTIADTFSITRGPRTNLAPTVSITAPANGAEFNHNSPVDISVNAADSDQGLRELVFYANASRIGAVPAVAGTSAYTHRWTPPMVGSYRLEVRAVDLLGNSAVSQSVDISIEVGGPAPDTTAPGAITNISTAPGINDVTLTWRAPGDDGADSGTAVGYDIRYSTTDPATDGSPDKATWWAAATQVADEPVPLVAGSTQSFAVAGLIADTTYYFAIKAIDEAANVGAVSNLALGRTLTEPPAAPTTLTAVNAAGGVNLAWTDNSSDEDGFSIERSLDGTTGFAQIQWVGPNTTTHFDALVYAGTTYFYRVIAVKGTTASTPTNVAKVTTPPATPTNFSATATVTQVSLTWNGSTGAQSYTVSRFNPGSGAFDVIVSGLAATAYTDGGLAGGTSYTYRVSAVNLGGTSAPAELTVQTMAPNPPSAPASLVTAAASSSEIQLTWADTSANEDGFAIERSTDGVAFAQIATAAANATGSSDAGLSAGTTYWYRVRAYNADGSSDYSNVASATTLAPQLPAAPSNLRSTSVGPTEIALAWDDNSANEGGFYLESSVNGGAFVRIATLAANATTSMDTGLTSGATYAYRIQSFNADGLSAYSNTLSIATPSAPSAPTSLTGQAISKSQINISWADASDNETGFSIERSTDGTNFAEVATVGANVTTFANTGLQRNRLYYYRVRAFNTVGNSAYSNTFNTKTLKN